MSNFWHTANKAFSPAEREDFNKWRIAMFNATDKASVATQGLPDKAEFSDVCSKARAAHQMSTEIPVLKS